MNQVKFTFEVDARAEDFCLRIARDMVKIFGIPLSEAVGRINKQWRNNKIIGLNLVYHKDSEEWAKIIYYEDGTFWWIEKWMAEHRPKPKSYP